MGLCSRDLGSLLFIFVGGGAVISRILQYLYAFPFEKYLMDYGGYLLGYLP